MTNDIRQRFRAARRALSKDSQREHALAVKNAIGASSLLRQKTVVGCYLASDGEVDLSPTIELLWERKIATAVPVVHANSMTFYAYAKETDTLLSQWGIHEPIASTQIDTNDLLGVLVPLVAFTDRGQRLGRGRGYYDHVFKSSRRPILIGVAHEIQRARAFSTNASDVRLDGIVSENGLTMTM